MDKTASFATCRALVFDRVHKQGRSVASVALDMGYSQSDLLRKLIQKDRDSRRFTLDDLERFIEVTGDTRPVYYLVEKYLTGPSEKEALLKRIAELEQRDKVAEMRR